MKIIVIFSTAALVIIGGLWATWLDDKSIDVLTLFTTIFTGFAALGTAYAAYSAALSAKISASASTIWKQQMSFDIEIREAKDLKVSLNDWHRRFLSEAHSKDETLNDLLNNATSTPHIIKEVLIKHLQNYIDDLDNSWSTLEASFDNASFVGHDFEQRLRLRILHIAHRKAVNTYIEYMTFKNRLNLSHDDITLILTTIYTSNDWSQQDINDASIYRVVLDCPNIDSEPAPFLSDEREKVYISLHQSVEDLILNINIYVDEKTREIKSRVSNI
ncbi:hypothetical protein ACRN9T_02180 [Shewanella baltica]|uniref:hypothetical protein n=1 Tax=Shewanella baltica TaxID=62322 RepID=UPI003D793128